MLQRGTADLLIIPEGFCSDAHPVDILHEEEFVCLVWAGSERYRPEISIDEYLSARHVVVEVIGPNPSTFDTWFLKSYGVTREAAVTTFSFASAPRLVIGTDYIATVHRKLARKLARDLPVRMLELPVALPPMNQCLQWHHHHSSDPGIRWLRELIHESVAVMDRVLSPPP